MTVPELVRAVALQATDLPAEAVDIVPRSALEHQSNRLYDVWANGCHLIAKEFLQVNELREAPAREYQALRLLAAMDIAPRPVFFDPSLGPVVIYVYMEGEMWDRRRPSAADLGQLAELWLRMNNLPREGLWMSRGYERPLSEAERSWQGSLDAYAAWAEAEFPPGKAVVEHCLNLLPTRRAAVRDLSGCAPLLCFCLSDARFANVIRRPDGRLGIVDWEDSGLRDPARDLAILITHPNQEDLLSRDEWQAFLQPYLSARSQFDPQLADRMHLYLALAPLFWLAVMMNQGVRLAKAGQLAGWSINGLPPNVRLRRYLARALAWPGVDFQPQLQALADVAFFPSEEAR